MSTPPRPGPVIQVFGFEKDQATRAAQRFFKERRVEISFVDLRKRPIAVAELRRFVDRLGARALLDETSRAYRDGGLGYLRMDDAEIVERLLADPSLLVLPLVRNGNEVTAGRAEPTWKTWLMRLPEGYSSPPGCRIRRRATSSRITPAATSAVPMTAQRRSSTMKLEPPSTPSPWAIQTSPTRASSTPAMNGPRIGAFLLLRSMAS